MSGYACARGAADIHPDVVALRMIEILQSALERLCHFHHFRRRRRLEVWKRSEMAVWHDHDVPGSVRIPIQDDVILFAAMNDQRSLVVTSGRCVTKNTPIVSIRSGY